jgi:signal transduction histidine kinase
MVRSIRGRLRLGFAIVITAVVIGFAGILYAATTADDRSTFAWQLALAGAIVLVAGLAGGSLLSAYLLRPLTAMATAANHLSILNLSQRIPVEVIDVELQAVFEQLSRFTADASHELRTPLAVIRSHAQLALARPRSAEEYRQALETCLQATGRMSAIVDGLLMLARADAGKLGLKKESVALAELVDDAAKLVRPLAESREIGLTLELSPMIVPGDREALTRIVSNLLANAVQYNRPKGQVCLRLSASTGAAVLTVADTGLGIPTADQPHIFERFYRVDKSRSRQQKAGGHEAGGTGLGLAICRSLVEAHGGRIECESMEDVGTTFRVRLPLT